MAWQCLLIMGSLSCMIPWVPLKALLEKDKLETWGRGEEDGWLGHNLI